MESYIPNKYLNTPQRIYIIDRSTLLHETASEIKLVIDISTPTIRRTLRSEVTRHNKNPISKTPQKINVRDLRQFVRAVINSSDKRRESYLQLTADLRIKASKSTIRYTLRKAEFRRYIVYSKSLVL